MAWPQCRQMKAGGAATEISSTFVWLVTGGPCSGAKGGGSSHSTNESSQRRAFLLPWEFKELGVHREVLILENGKPILADEIRYDTDPVFMDRLMPPPELPELHLATHRARVEHRVRLAGDDAEFGLDQIAGDFHGRERPQAIASTGRTAET